ncbi:dihydrofolate reductase family protein [Chthonobacter rhizosphaerae]|uniref:dihydrofolate reductase family protein n=1 Tax=Chthonobacter rhizosphaerae TaxID=2735553 RepID=UPI0015EEAFFA|nr:dihydrofolate reductase family protein [Chthonobacter rhizosphaerae]
MRRIRGYMAMSIDGFIAEPDGGVRFLDAYPPEGADWDAFWSSIGTVVTGRLTWETVVRLNHHGVYAGRRGFLVTSRPDGAGLPLPDGFGLWGDGVDALVSHLRAAEDLPAGDIWILGGGLLQQAFLDRDAIDLLELFVVPEVVGDGIRAFPGGLTKSLRLVGTDEAMPGVVRLAYKRRGEGRP